MRCVCVADVVFCSAYFIHGVVCVFVFSACAAAALRFACVAQIAEVDLYAIARIYYLQLFPMTSNMTQIFFNFVIILSNR